MMGHGALGVGTVLIGGLAVLTIWGGLWWLLSAIGFHATQRHHEPPVPPPFELGPDAPPQHWQQPPFPSAVRPSAGDKLRQATETPKAAR